MKNKIKLIEDMDSTERNVVLKSVNEYIDDRIIKHNKAFRDIHLRGLKVKYTDLCPEFAVPFTNFINLYVEYLDASPASLVRLMIVDELATRFQKLIYVIYTDAIPGFVHRVDLEIEDKSIKSITIHQYDDSPYTVDEIKSNVIKFLDFLYEKFKFKSSLLSSFVNDVPMTNELHDRKKTHAISWFG